jgi:YrbI family 3-deoxy-D-manno-octulosonate 8-phosphate phosphatase
MRGKKMTYPSFNDIKLIALDFDGVLTDNTVITDENGKESVICNRSDGLAIEIIKEKGIEIIVLSKEKNKVVNLRCKKLNITCIQGLDEKLHILKNEIKKRNLTEKQVCYVGNDINDIDCIKYVGLGIAVNDAYPKVKKIANFITQTDGGRGVIREILNYIK